MTRRISSSRPMTGSSLPARASAVRSRPYFSRAAYVPSGFGDVTRWPPRTLWSALRMASRPAPWRSSSWLALAADLGDAEQEVLGRDVLVAEPAGLLPRPARSTRLARGSRDSEPPWIRARLAEDRGELAAERRAGRRRAGGASRRGRRRRARRARERRCSASRTGLSSRWAVAWAATMASWAFWV